jgi:glyoxylase-like metal-dependent hydrolase (beta-lactamase superfamily II)
VIRKFNILLIGALFGTQSSVSPSQTQYDYSKVEVRPQKLAENFHVFDETEVHGGSVSALTGPDGVLLLDTGVGPLAAKVASAIGQITSQPIRYVINTHAHIDETGGNEYFAHLGATLVGRDLMRFSMLHPKEMTSAAQGKSLDDVVAAKVAEGLGAQAQPGHISAEAFVRDVYAELKTAP